MRRAGLVGAWLWAAVAMTICAPFVQAAEPPVITTQPQGSTNVTATEVTFTVVATGTAPLRYQWYFNVTNRLSGATSSSLTYTNLGAFREGFYTVVITNIAGAVTSNPALLIVLEPPAVTRQPTNQIVAVGGTAFFTVAAVGDAPLTYQWFFNVIDEIPGATNTTLVLTNLQPSQSGTYQVEVSNDADTVNSVEAILLVKRPPSFSSQPADAAVPQGGPASFSASVSGDGPFGYQWFFNSTNVIFGATNLTLTISNAQLANAGTYSVVATNIVGRVTSTPATLTVLQAPSISQQPVGTSVVAGATVTLSVAASGSAPLRYQWLFNSTNSLASETNATLTLSNVQAQNAGVYSVLVTNLAGSAASTGATLSVITPPAITQQPANVSNPIGQPATFAVQATGSAPLAYRWLFNGTVPIAGATSASFTLNSAQLVNGGLYSVVVTNLAGAVTSAPAALIIQSPPIITQQPANRSAALGGPASFSVIALGETPFAYQWFFNTTNALPEGTNATFALVSVQPANVGRYSVFVSNRLGAVTSIEVALTLKQSPGITQQPASLVVTQGAAAAFSVGVAGDGPFGYRWLFNGTNAVPGTNGPALTINPAFATSAGTYSVLVTNDVGSVTSSEATLTVRVPPLITQHPTNVFTPPGTAVSLAITATGDQPLRYQWFFELTNAIPDATNAAITINNVQLANDGRYQVRVSNDVGSATSVNATLRVRNLPTITEPPASLTVTQGQFAVFSVQTGGDGPFTYQWFFNGTNPVANARSATLTLSNVQPASAGQYSIRVTNQVGFVISPEAALAVRRIPTITQQPASRISALGSTVTFSVIVTGEEPFTYQWRFNGTNNLLNATNTTLTLSNVQPGEAGVYSVVVGNAVGSATSADATLAIQISPSITQQPASLVSTQGQTVAFSSSAAGDAPLFYQWFLNTTNAVAGATGPTLTLSNIQPAAAGEYTMLVTNLVGSARSAPALLEVKPLPGILQQPFSLVVTQGQTASFTVVGTSDSPLTYQWRRNGDNVSATNFTLTVSNAQPAAAGQYDVIVGNSFGAITSALATLTVFGIDFGDAPQPGYATLAASNGARHIIVPGVRLGAAIDAEPDGQASALADGDDTSSTSDEDGVRFSSPLRTGQPVQIEVIASTNGLLNAWIDFNRTNGWAQAGEQVFTNQPLVPGTNLLPVLVPANAAIGGTFARFRFSTTSGLTFTNLAPDGEVEDYRIAILPAADLQLTQAASAATVAAGSNVTVTLHLTNAGPSTASNVILTAQLSARSSFVSAATSVGSCLHNGSLVTCSLGNLATNAGANINIITGVGQGTNRTLVTATANEFDPDGASRSILVVGTSSTPQFANSDAIIMPLPDPGIADPYPASVIVSGITSAVNRAIVTIRNLNHDYPDDVDLLLVGPGGQGVVLMSDSGLDTRIVDATLVFDDEATQELPDGSELIASGGYRPTNHPPDGDTFPAPAPAGPYAAELTVFRGTNPNGVWSLYVLDDSVDNGTSEVPGFIADGWTLSFVTDDPLADLEVTANVTQTLVSIGEPVLTSITVSNLGPADSSAVVSSILATGMNYVSATTPQGSCAHDNGTVICNFGVLPVGGSVTFSIQTIPVIGGLLTNTITVAGGQLDLNITNNTYRAVAAVRPAADLKVTLSGPAAVLLNQPFDSILTISNLGPNTAAGVRLTNELPAGTAFVSATVSQGSCSPSGATVVCSLGDLPAGAASFVQIRCAAGLTGINSNHVAVTTTDLDPVPANNSASAVFNVEPAIDLALSSFASASSLPVGDDFLVVLTVSNRGPSTVNATLVNNLPPNATFISVSSTRAACTNVAGEIHCQINSLATGENAVIAVTTRTTAFGAITNSATVTGSLADYNPANNAVTNVASVVPAADLTLTMVDHPNPLWLGDTLTSTLSLTNRGPNAATNVVVTNFLPVGVTFISAAASQGTCTRVGNEVRCDLGAMAAGNSTVINIIIRHTQAGFHTNRAVAASPVLDSNPAGNSARQTTRVVTATGSYANGAPVSTPLLGIANPYPSVINISGLTSAISAIRVTLTNLSHTYSDDLDVLLVGPAGQTAMLMSDCGGDFSMNGVTLTFDDGAAGALPDGGAIFGGFVRPSNFGTEADVFPAPAPLGAYGTNLTAFIGTDPNGPWSLYILDDADKDSGVLLNGWTLTLSTLDPIADLTVAQTPPASPSAVGSNVVFTYTVTNRGPGVAINARLTNSLPSSLNASDITPSQGACNLAGGIVECGLGNLPPNGVATVVIVATSSTAGTVTNRIGIVSDSVDLIASNNAAVAVNSFELPPVITLQPISQTTTNGGFVQFTAAAAGAAPLQYQWQRNGSDVIGATSPTLNLIGITDANAGVYRLRVRNAVGVALSAPATLSVIGPPFISTIAAQSIDEDGDTGPVAFTLLDFDTPAESVSLLGFSSNPALVPALNIFFGGGGESRTVRVAPAANLSGTALIFIVASDNTGLSSTNQFSLIVRPVIDPIQILVQPRNMLVVTGATAVLSVTAASSLPLSYQWEKDAAPIAGATGSSLTITNISANNAGGYRVRISNADTNVFTNVGTLQVTDNFPSPNIVSISRNGTTAVVSFTTIAGATYTLEYKNTLEDTAWTPLGSLTGSGNTEILSDIDATITTRFYRIRAE